eukprot:15360945-Ditylum_brightwellii.AAC.1
MAAVLTTKKSTPPWITSHLCPDFDVIVKLQSELWRAPNFSISLVKAHQDEKQPFHELPLDAQLNCIADKYAEHFCTSASPDLQSTEFPPKLQQNKTYMIVNGQDNVMDMINWDALG